MTREKSQTRRLGVRLAGVFLCVLAALALRAGAQAPATTLVSDVVYRADGTPASGTVVLSWPAFNTADDRAVAAGSMTLAIGAGGVVSIALAPTVDAEPSGTYYRVVLKLDESVTNRDIVDEAKFRDGLSKIIDGVVQCLNASAWAKAK